jgi:hypothetical protein
MRPLALVPLVAAVLALAPAARADACSPLNCAPSQFSLDHGRLLATRAAASGPIRVLDLRTGTTVRRLPAGVVAGDVLVSRAGDLLVWRNLVTGRVLETARVELPQATLVGASQDGSRAVLSRSDLEDGETFVVAGHGAVERVHFALIGGWEFDALSGSRLYLIHDLPRGYQVRLYDLTTHHLRARPLKDPEGSSTIWGSAFARLSSRDARYLFTLYIAPDGGSMIHQLDLRNAVARCIDLPGNGDVPGTGDFNAAMTTSLALSPDGRTLWAVSPGYGRATAIDIATHRVRTVLRFGGYWQGNAGLAAVAPDGRIAATEGTRVWVVEPRRHRVVQSAARTVHALGFGTGGRLWAIGRNAAVYSLRL